MDHKGLGPRPIIPHFAFENSGTATWYLTYLSNALAICMCFTHLDFVSCPKVIFGGPWPTLTYHVCLCHQAVGL